MKIKPVLNVQAVICWCRSQFVGRGLKMTENSYKTPYGCIHYFVNIIDKQKITLVFLPGLTADHRLFEKQIDYFEKKQNVFVWDAPSHAFPDHLQIITDFLIWLNGCMRF